MKLIKIISFCLLFLLSISSAFAFTISEFNTSKEKYKIVLEKKLSSKLEKLSETKLEELHNKVIILIDKVEASTKISDKAKLKKLSLLFALEEIIENQDKAENKSIVEQITIKIIEDKRCSNCRVEQLIDNLKNVPVLSDIEINRVDFSEDGVKKYLEDNNIKALPAVIFNRNYIDKGLDSYLIQLESKEYKLSIGSTFDPFVEMSEKGFKVVDKEILKNIKLNSYIKGNKNAEITWLEYSDLECPFCARLHNNGTPNELEEKYGDKLNIIFNHFPLSFHNNAQVGAEILECVGSEKGSEAFYSMIETTFSEEDSSKIFLTNEAVKLGVSKEKIEKCLENETYKEKVEKQMGAGTKLFKVTGTPGNVLINNNTGEYIVISGAYPTSYFEENIDKLLK